MLWDGSGTAPRPPSPQPWSNCEENVRHMSVEEHSVKYPASPLNLSRLADREGGQYEALGSGGLGLPGRPQVREEAGRDTGLWVHLLYTQTQRDLTFSGARPPSPGVQLGRAGLWTDGALRQS